MTDQADDMIPADNDKAPAATQQGAPDRELELKLKRNPQDLDSKTDVGSDQSMDASDPIASTQPGNGDPVPSSGFPDESSRD
ncbi:MAG: hypothetical protein V4696_09305 [Pseudomonadota bacterium]